MLHNLVFRNPVYCPGLTTWKSGQVSIDMLGDLV